MAERAKGRVLLDLITSGRPDADRVSTALERERERQLRARVASLGAQLRLAAEGSAGTSARRELDVRLDNARNDLATFRAQLSAAHPELGIRSGNVNTVTAQQAGALLPDQAAAILEYAVTPRATYLFVIERGQGVRMYALPISAEVLRQQVQELREKLATRDPEFPALATRLYQALLGPARAQLARKSRLILAPDADLWQVPFQALRSPEGRYLIEDASIFYTPSLSVLHALGKRKPMERGGALAAFANPTEDWPEAEREASRLAALYGASSRTWVRAEANEEAFRAHAGSYDVLHVAAHGVFDDRHPLHSHLVLHGPAGKDSLDGLLEAEEIRALDLKASLVVLSGCETARGQFEDGEGAIGMTWAFLAAGSRAVVASQWRVESSSTTQLMLRFHSALREGLGKAAALRQATLEVMRSESFRHPFYWAGFALFGEGY
jgi:CHAT domain-containing protein